MKFYINTRDRSFYDSSGALLAEGNPQIPYKSRQEIAFQLCKNTPDAGFPGTNPEEWSKDTSFDLPGVSAILSLDSDFKRRNKGELAAGISAGSVTSVTANFANVKAANFRIPGTLRIFDEAGNAEMLEYTGISVENQTVTFNLAEKSTITGSYGAKTVIDAPDSLYMQAPLNAEKSNPGAGLFVFDLVADSVKLREALDYSDVSVLSSIAGLELLIFTAENDKSVLERNSFVCSTVSVTGTIGEPGATVTLPSAEENALLLAVSALLAKGTVAEYSLDRTEWHTELSANDRYLRFRLANSSANSDSWVVMEMKEGTPGKAGKDGADGLPGKDGEPGPKGDTGSPAGFGNITARAETIPTGYSASAVVTASGTNEAKNFSFVFQIPQGEKGDPMRIDATGVSTDLRNYDAQLKGFAFLATDTGKVYIKASDTVGDWSDPVGFQGPAGESAGFGTPTVSIEAIEEGENPSATVEATGSNTSKVFNFNFKLPKGKQGEQGEPGTIENFEIKVNSLTSGKIAVKVNALPVMVKAPSGNYYPIEKTRLTGSTSAGWQIDPAPFLGYENMASFTGTWSVFCAGGVKGEAGEDGKNFDPDATGIFSERAQYDSRKKGFAFLATDQEGSIYIKNSAAVGDWSAAIPFRGPKGDSPDISIGANGNWEVDGVDIGKPSRGEAGPMAQVEIAPNGNWIVNGVDTGKPSRGRGANIIISPTMPTEPFEGMILISAQGVDPAFFDLEALKVLKGSTPPVTAEEGTIFIMEQ